MDNRWTWSRKNIFEEIIKVHILEWKKGKISEQKPHRVTNRVEVWPGESPYGHIMTFKNTKGKERIPNASREKNKSSVNQT